MSKPIENVTLKTTDDKTVHTMALFDTGSFYTIVRADILPQETPVLLYKDQKVFGTAGKEGQVRVQGVTELVIAIGEKMISTRAYVSPDLRREFIVGAETMQAWDISIHTTNGKTQIHVGHDMRDPDITEVD